MLLDIWLLLKLWCCGSQIDHFFVNINANDLSVGTKPVGQGQGINARPTSRHQNTVVKLEL